MSINLFIIYYLRTQLLKRGVQSPLNYKGASEYFAVNINYKLGGPETLDNRTIKDPIRPRLIN